LIGRWRARISFHGAILFIGDSSRSRFHELASPRPRKNLVSALFRADDCIVLRVLLVQLYARGDKSNVSLHAMFEYRVIASS